MSENLTNYTIVGSHLSNTSSTTVTATTLQGNEVSYDYYDFGNGYFGIGSYFESTFNYTSTTWSSGKFAYFHSGFSDTLAAAYPSGGNESLAAFVSGSGNIIHNQATKVESNTYTAGVANVVNLTSSTNYYIRSGYLSSIGGQYGGVLSQVFSNAGMTTVVISNSVAMTASGSYRYFMAAQSANVASDTSVITCTHSSITVYRNAIATGRDMTGATLSGSGVAAYADCAVATTLANNVDTYLYFDDGSAHYNGSFTMKGVLNVTAVSNAASVAAVSSLQNVLSSAGTTNAAQGIKVTTNGTTTISIAAREVYSAAEYLSTAIQISSNVFSQPVFTKLWRDTTVGTYGTLYIAAYSNPDYTNQIGSTQSIALHASVNFEYYFPVQSYNNGNAYTTTFTFGGVGAFPTILATKGTFSWAGKSSPLSAQNISAAIGAFSWAGKSSPLSIMVQASKGTFSWAGKPANVNAGGQVNAGRGTFGFAGKSSPLSFSIAGKIGSFGWAGKTSILGAVVTSVRTWEITKWDTVTQKEIPVTGLTNVLYMLYNPSTGKILDFSDNTFKASSSCTTPQGTMIERILLDSHGNNLTPGIYDILLSTTGLSGLYQEFGIYYGTNNYFNSNAVRFQDGVEYLGGLTVTENTHLIAVPTNPVLITDPRMDLLKYKHVLNSADGTVKYYDVSNNLVYSGFAYMDAAMTKLYDGTAPVVATSWIS